MAVIESSRLDFVMQYPVFVDDILLGFSIDGWVVSDVARERRFNRQRIVNTIFLYGRSMVFVHQRSIRRRRARIGF